MVDFLSVFAKVVERSQYVDLELQHYSKGIFPILEFNWLLSLLLLALLLLNTKPLFLTVLKSFCRPIFYFWMLLTFFETMDLVLLLFFLLVTFSTEPRCFMNLSLSFIYLVRYLAYFNYLLVSLIYFGILFISLTLSFIYLFF